MRSFAFNFNFSVKQDQKQLDLMRECLRKLNDQGVFSNLDNPLDPSVRLKGLR